MRVLAGSYALKKRSSRTGVLAAPNRAIRCVPRAKVNASRYADRPTHTPERERIELVALEVPVLSEGFRLAAVEGDLCERCRNATTFRFLNRRGTSTGEP